jgi:hypothetical protein
MPRFSLPRFRALLLLLVLLACGLAGIPEARATLRRTPGAMLFGPKGVWTDGTTTAFFQPLSDAIPSAGLINARVTFEMSEDSGYCKMRPAMRSSVDGIGWDASAAIDATWRTSSGIVYGSSYVDLSQIVTVRQYVQFGVDVANDTGGSGFQFCNATMMVEPKERP